MVALPEYFPCNPFKKSDLLKMKEIIKFSTALEMTVDKKSTNLYLYQDQLNVAVPQLISQILAMKTNRKLLHGESYYLTDFFMNIDQQDRNEIKVGEIYSKDSASNFR